MGGDPDSESQCFSFFVIKSELFKKICYHMCMICVDEGRHTCHMYLEIRGQLAAVRSLIQWSPGIKLGLEAYVTFTNHCAIGQFDFFLIFPSLFLYVCAGEHLRQFCFIFQAALTSWQFQVLGFRCASPARLYLPVFLPSSQSFFYSSFPGTVFYQFAYFAFLQIFIWAMLLYSNFFVITHYSRHLMSLH